MEEFLSRFVDQAWHAFVELAPWLLIGLLLAGIIHVLLPGGFLLRHFGRRGIRSVVRASILGVPLPLCSCGVIPTALGLHRDGASRGASIGFLISTPQTGVDSFLVSANFLGWPFAVFKVISSFVTGVLGGVLTDLWTGEEESPPGRDVPLSESEKQGHMTGRTAKALRFAFVRLLGDIYLWVLIGVAVAGLIGAAIPPAALAGSAWASGFIGMILTLLIAVPMYVCSAASVPIAAAMVQAGFPPGAALVFLVAGPATNVATLGAVFRAFGARAAAIYLGTVVSASLLLGQLFNFVIDADRIRNQTSCLTGHLPGWLSEVVAVLLVGLVIWHACRGICRRWIGAGL